MKDKREKDQKAGKREKTAVTAVLGLAVMLGLAGCAKGTETPDKVWEDASSADGGSGDLQDDADTPKTQTAEWEREEPVSAKTAEPEENGAQTADGAGDSQKGGDSGDVSELTGDSAQTVKASEGTEHLGGKIQKLQADGMTFAHTSLVEDSMVTILDVEDAEKIQVRFTEDTKVEHWIIQGGGAGIDMQDAAFSDLKEGMGVELEGYYDGDTFVATKVIMEDYM